MSSILSALVAHWRIVGVWALVEVAQLRMERSLDVVDSLQSYTAQRDSQAVQVERRLVAEREESQRIEQAASESVGQAEAQVAITLDSLRSAPSPELLDRLEAEIEEERDAHRTVVRALRVQLTAADSMTVLWRSRHADAVKVNDAQAIALQEAQSALAARIAQSQGSWSDPVVGALKYAGVFAAGYALASR